MANEFVARNGIIAKDNSTITGTLAVSGNITMGGVIVATRTWVTGTALIGYATESYVTTAINNLIDSAPGALDTLNELAAALGDDPNFATTVTTSIGTKVSKAGDTMTGNINWGTSDRGLTWSMNTDGAYIKFFNTGDGDTNSRLEYGTSDNGNEFHRWMVSTTEEMTLKSDGLRVTDSIWMGGNLVATQAWVNSQNYLTTVPDEYLTETEGDALYAPISHTHAATDITSGTLAAARLSGNYAINVTGSAATLTTARTLTIGNTGKTFNGGADVAWTLAEIGAYAATNPSGYITSSGNTSGYSGTLLAEDNRTISPSELTAVRLKFGFTSWANNNTAPYADFLHLRSYTDASGGLDNLVMFRKDAIGMRIYQQTFGSTTAYSTFKDVAFTDSSITGNAATATTLQTARTLTIGNTGKTFNGSANVSWSLAEIGAQAALTNPVTGTGTTNYLPKLTGASTIGNSQVFDNGTNVGINTASPGFKLDVNGSANFTGFNINSINQITGVAYIEPLVSSESWSRTSTVDEWVKIISVSGSPRRIRLALNAGGDNTNMYDEFMISHSGYNMQTHIHRLPGSRYNVSKVAGIKVINSTAATQEVWVKLYGMTTPSGSFEYKANVAVLDEATVAASSQSAEPTGTSGSSILLFDVYNRDEYTTMSSAGGYFGGKGYFGGNVGIGTTNPIYKFQVAGSAYVNGGTLFIDSGNFLRWGNSAQGIRGVDSTSLDFYSGSSIRMTVLAGGNIGIGTSSPEYKLDVDGGPIRITNGFSEPTSEAGYRLKFADNGGINNDSGIGLSGSLGDESLWINKGSANGNIRFMFGTLGEKVTFTSSGNVGIGTTAPAATLHVVGTHYHFANTGFGTNLVRVDQYGTDSNYRLDYKQIVSGGLVKHSYSIVNNGTGYADNLVLDRGSVGIGTTSPAYKLDVNGVTAANGLIISGGAAVEDAINITNGRLTLGGHNSGAGVWYEDIAGASEWFVGLSADDVNYRFYNAPAATDRVVIYANGTVQFNAYGAGLLRTNASGSITVDTNTYLTGITAAQVHGAIYTTGGDANTYTTFGIYRNYAVNGPIAGHNTILNVMQYDGNYGFQLGADTTSSADGLYFRSKDATIGTWKQVASREWVTAQGYATTGYVDTAIANLVDTAPDALNTLNELATALGDDPNFATTVTNSIAGKVSKSGDTMTGTLTLSYTYPRINLYDTNNDSDYSIINNDGSFIVYDATNNSTRFSIAANGNASFNGTINASNFSGTSSGTNTGDQTTISGNAGSATVLQTARTLTIGNTGKSFNGSANVSWTLAEIGAQPAGSYLTAEADTLATVTGRGRLTSSSGSAVWDETIQGTDLGNIQLDTVATDNAGGAITWKSSDGGTGAQAGIYVRSDGNYGTKMYIATSDNYSVGSKTAISIDHSGFVNVTRGNDRLRVNGNTVWHAGNDGAGTGLDADLLDGQQGSYYLDWTNVTNKPDPVITLAGAVTGAATMTDLGNITITTTATSDPVLTLAGDATGSATFTNLGNATLTVTVVDDSHTHDGRYYTEAESDARFVNVTGDTVTGDLTVSGAALGVISTAAGSDAFYVDGVNGRLFTVTDSLDDSLFSVNTVAGLPVIEAFADNTVNLGPFTNPVTISSTGTLSIGGLQAATQSYVDTAITNLIGGAPGALDTLNELAAAINDDASYASTITSALALKAPLASPALTGTPTAPTAATATNSTQIATTAFVKAQGYITGYTETDTLATVTGRGNTANSRIIINSTGAAGAPTLSVNTSTSSTFVHSQENLAANLTAGQHNIIVVGKTGNTKNSGYIGYYWAGAASDSNFVTIGHWGADDLFRVYGDGRATVGTNTVWHAGNDGSGSGLDADLLDGQQGSYYQPASTAITTSNIGSQSVSYASSAGSSGYASYTPRVAIEDTRAAQRTPNDYEDYRASWEFTNQIAGISDWHSAMTLQGWHDNYSAWQIIGGSSTSAHENWYLRSGNVTTWNPVRRIWHSGDFTSTNVSNWNTAYGWGNHAGLYLPIGGGNATGWVSFSSSTQGTPIIKAVQQDSSSGYYLFQGVTGSSEVFRVERTGNIVTSGTLSASGYNKSNWDAAHSWGNHADYGYWNTDLADPKTVQSTDVIFAGNVTVQGTFTESSSIRFKENIVDLESSTEKVEQLRPVRYNKIGVEEEEIGLIAEEVAEIYPEVVTYNEEGQPSGVNYTRLSVILLKSVQELAERINKLENK